MKLLVIVLCLLSERFLVHSIAYTRFQWFERYCAYIQRLCSNGAMPTSSSIILAATILPLIGVAGLVYWLLASIYWGSLGVLFSLLMFYYCLGPQNPFYPLVNDLDSNSDMDPVINYFSRVNNQLFAVIFWFVVAGPIAVLCFRLISLSQENTIAKDLSKDLTELLEWIPARLTALFYLLVGNFQAGIKKYISMFFSSAAKNNKLLADCSMLAAHQSDQNEITMPMAETLVEHSLVVLLVFIALLTLASWL